jgi:hypothetical protein
MLAFHGFFNRLANLEEFGEIQYFASPSLCRIPRFPDLSLTPPAAIHTVHFELHWAASASAFADYLVD